MLSARPKGSFPFVCGGEDRVRSVVALHIVAYTVVVIEPTTGQNMTPVEHRLMLIAYREVMGLGYQATVHHQSVFRIQMSPRHRSVAGPLVHAWGWQRFGDYQPE